MNEDTIPTTQTVRVDTHAHVFLRSLPLIANRRYAPADDAPLPTYLQCLERHGLTHGVLVQPSFLGTNNDFMVQMLKEARGRLRGVAVVDPSISNHELRVLRESGVVGIRLNLIGATTPDIREPEWQPLLAFVREHQWHVEVHAPAEQLADIVSPLLKQRVKVVVDHFGRPSGQLGVNDPGFRYLLSVADSQQVWVKTSGVYRLGPRGAEVAQRATAELIAAFGAPRLLWGSDWPHTTFEHDISYDWTVRQFESCVPSKHLRQVMLGATAAELFQIDLT